MSEISVPIEINLKLKTILADFSSPLILIPDDALNEKRSNVNAFKSLYSKAFKTFKR